MQNGSFRIDAVVDLAVAGKFGKLSDMFLSSERPKSTEQHLQDALAYRFGRFVEVLFLMFYFMIALGQNLRYPLGDDELL